MPLTASTLSRSGAGDGWRLEEWHYAVTLPCSLMNNSSVLCQVASNIGRMHKLHRRADFPTSIPRVSATSMRLESWGKSAVEAARSVEWCLNSNKPCVPQGYGSRSCKVDAAGRDLSERNQLAGQLADVSQHWHHRPRWHCQRLMWTSV